MIAPPPPVQPPGARQAPRLPPTPRPPRIPGRWVAILGFAGIFLALLAIPDPALKLNLGALAVLGLLVIPLRGLLARIRPAPLSADVDHFHICLPGAWPGLLWIAASIAAAIFWLNLVPPKPLDMLRQLQPSLDLASIGLAWLLLIGSVLFPIVALALLIPAFADASPWSVRGGAGRLQVAWPHRVSAFNLAELQAWKVESGAGGGAAALHLVSGRRRAVLAAGGSRPGQPDFIDQLADWLAAHGVTIQEGGRLVTPPAWHSALRVLVVQAAMFACIILPAGLALAASFWIPWLLTGSYAMTGPVLVAPAGFALGALLLATPLAGWLTRLFTFAWLAPKPPAGVLRAYAMEDLGANELFTSRVRRALLRERDGALEVTIGQTSQLIHPGDILELERLGIWASLLLGLDAPFQRCYGRPFRLSWQDANADHAMVHSLLIASRSGATNGRDRRLDRELFRRLTAWRAGEAALDFSPLRTASARPGALVAALFLLVCFAVPPLHNHLLLTRVRTGAWLSPAPWARIGGNAWLERFHAVIPGQVALISEYAGAANPPAVMPALWVGDPLQGRMRAIRFGLAGLFNATPALPGSLTHLFCPGEELMGVTLIPPRLRTARELFPPQVVDLKTGLGKDIRALPYGSTVALYAGERLFYANEKNSGTPQIETDMGWFDLAEDRRHDLGRLSFPDTERQVPVFFPGGDRVLCAWRIINLETGAIRPLESDEKQGWEFSHESRVMTFAQGNKLIKRVELTRKTSATSTSLPYWTHIEIDPDTARWREVKLPGNQYILSADDGRWLVYEGKTTGAPGAYSPASTPSTPPAPPPVRAFSLYDPVTGRVRELFREVPQNQYFLVRGRDEILIQSSTGVWSRRPIPPAKDNKDTRDRKDGKD